MFPKECETKRVKEIICLRCGLKCEVRLDKDHRHFRSRMDANIQNMFEINYSQLIQYEILEKLVTLITKWVGFEE